MGRQLRRRGPSAGRLGALILALAAVGLAGCREAPRQWIPGWQPASAMSLPRAGAAAVVHGDFIYVLGGVDGKRFLSTTEYAQIHSDGSLGPWRPAAPLPAARGFADAVVHGRRIYLVGGANGRNGQHLLDTVLSAPILADGALGPWQAQSQSLSLPRRCAKVIHHEGRLLAFGGFAGTLLDSVEEAALGDDGATDPWRLHTTAMTRPRYVNGIKAVNGFVFILGGHHPRQGVGLAAVERAPLTAQDLNWQPARPMGQGRYALATAANQQRLYALGGISGADYLASVEMAAVGGDGALGPWRATTPLPEPLASFSAVTHGDRLYILGGTSGRGYRAAVYFAEFGEDGHPGFYGTGAEAERHALARRQRRAEAGALPHQGVVVSAMDAGGYTYIQVRRQGRLEWLAAPAMDLRRGAVVRFSEGVYMSNFYSQQLNRRFAAIRFVGTVETQSETLR